MKKKVSISSGISVVFGCFIALIVLTQSVQTVQYQADEDTEQESDGANSEEKVSVVQPEAIPNSTSSVSLEASTYLLEELEYMEASDEETNSFQQVVQRIQKAIKILFRKIISPNAP